MSDKNKNLLNIVNIEEILKDKTPLDHERWESILKQHPEDIASLTEKLDRNYQIEFINKVPAPLVSEVFENLDPELQAQLILELQPDEAANILKGMSPDNLTDVFEFLPDNEVKKSLKLLQSKQRKQVISLLSFDPKSAGGIMNTDVLSLHTDFSIKKCIALLQKIRPARERKEKFYVTDKNNTLVGHIHLEDFVLNKPDTLLKDLVHKNELEISVREDQEEVAKKMNHYGLVSAPVVDDKNQFLGIISGEDVFDILEEENSEDVYKISGVQPVKHAYFQVPFWQLIWQRSPWLVSLLLLQSISGFIMANYNAMLEQYTVLSLFITMLIGTGGNAGNQTGAIVIRGLATGDINPSDGTKMLFREFKLALTISLMLSLVAYARVIITHQDPMVAIAISLSLFMITVVAMLMGGLLPLLLDKFNFDPANSAQPFLATLMDIIGIFIYCMITSKILGF